jgi:hypothetical protein
MHGFLSETSGVSSLGLQFSLANFVADAALKITKVVSELFPNATRTTCWAHTWRNLSNILKTVPGELSKRMGDDIHFLQLLTSHSMFKFASALFVHKWKQFKEIKGCIERIITTISKTLLGMRVTVSQVLQRKTL